MSPGYSGRYQSKILNFVHLQTRRLTEKWNHSFRHLQVKTKWGVELLLYPLYQLLNPTVSASQTLEGKTTQPKWKLSPQTSPTADKPIKQVLAAVKNLSPQPEPPPLKFWGFVRSKLFRHSPTPVTITENSSENIQPYLPVIRGIATNLVGRNLVIVTGDNEILDILTPQQQAKLAARIITEVGNYWHSWQLINHQPQPKLLLKINRNLAQITGKIAVNIPTLPPGVAENSPHPHQFITFLDVSMARWENSALLPMQQRSQEILRVVQTQLNIFVYGKAHVAAINDELDNHTPHIYDLIEAAISYFFGDSKDKKLHPQHSQRKSNNIFPASSHPSQLQNDDLARDSWLNFSDLFGSFQTITNKLVTSENRVEEKPKAKSSHHLTRTGKNVRKSQAITQNSDHSQLDFQPDWIDVEATVVGYDKHPLEQLLQWLDRLLLWIEQILINIFAFFQGLFRGK
ncbi:hypothetical protein VB620_02930 [Nodularia harveyana UHCC-0300]|uniref:Uncharacterized protein n=1 Tax=Nodularia harveyana UHCC-0300 TaxID=2974287 RepID=A0ABU5UCY9_9CYAN|nr:hypothetical protein [Nodularia harveyana]MEA5580291.1 hypothetical protein [Nodularia harveyana UHCC-0300]